MSPAAEVSGDDALANGSSRTPANDPRGAPTADTKDDNDDVAIRKLSEKKNKIKSKSSPPGGFDPTPLPDAPQGYTVKFTFHRAFNLPVADIQTSSADPFIHATLTAPVPKRHKEDPPLTRRTRTIRNSTEPVWDEEWVVANIPPTGFTLKCRLYDEDYANHDDRLGNVTFRATHVDENWQGLGPDGCVFDIKKRAGSKRYYLLRGITAVLCSGSFERPKLHLRIQVLGKSDPPHAQMYTVGPTTWIKHFSPMIGRLTGTKVNKNEDNDEESETGPSEDASTKKYDFQANEIQLSGPVPPKLYHRYVEFRPMIGRMFSSQGLRGRVLSKALHKQHRRVYNFDSGTEHGEFSSRSEDTALQFLKMAHFDQGGRIFTYVITLDGMLRFTETGKEFGIDLLSKHTMHSDVAPYIAFSGEFFIRRLASPDANADTKQKGGTHPPNTDIPGGPPDSSPPHNPKRYRLIIDNDSGTYRPDKSVLPELKKFLERNFPGLDIVALHWEDEQLKDMKKEQMEVKNKEGGPRVRMVLNRSPTASSFSSDDESRLGEMERAGDAPVPSKKETVFDAIQNPNRIKDVFRVASNREATAQGSNGAGKA
ncbi:C2 domain-containing protein [Immersiella caudata]|uniref:C2 domain-containing protein n=1 Tax=Immersiella caudata TaxID=314043 RepID=A0AA39W499_9PEZI|nr:C2 domain-containing protein [Immersiella caudata]